VFYSASYPLAGTEGAASRRREEQEKGGTIKKERRDKDRKKWKETP